MLLEEKTLQEFGHTYASISNGSRQKVYLVCDYCHKEYTKTKKDRVKQNELLDKDACFDCRYKKRDDVCLIKYGVTNPFASEEVKARIQHNNMEHYGVEHFTQTEDFKNKSKQTMLKKYGVTNAMHSEELKQKAKESNLNKYGVENASQAEEVKEKRKQTCRELFGSDYFMTSDIGREKLLNGVQEKYGVDNVFQSKEIKQKIKETKNKQESDN